jgi:hypothetical protein
MTNSRVSEENRISSTGYGRFDVETAEAPPGPKRTPWNAAGTVDPQPTIQPVSERFPALEKQEIILTLLAPDARKVNVAGNFNGWRPQAAPMKNLGDGKWLVRLMLRAGQYEYRFVVDDNWIEDPGAAQRVSNSFGDFNSVLLVPLPVKTSLL